MPKKGEKLLWTERPCKKCGKTFSGRGKASVCGNCKYTCPKCGGKKRDKTSKMCLNCKYERHGRLCTGEKSSSWRGGHSTERYGSGWTDTFKRKVRKLAGYVCSECGKPQSEEAGGLKLQIHHLDHSKDNHSLENLIVVCRDCHYAIHNGG